MKQLRQIAFLFLAFAASPLVAQEISPWQEMKGDRFSFQTVMESFEFQSAISLILVCLGGFFLIYLLGTLALGVEDQKEKKSAVPRTARRIHLPGVHMPRVSLEARGGATMLRAASHPEKPRSSERDEQSTPGRG